MVMKVTKLWNYIQLLVLVKRKVSFTQGKTCGVFVVLLTHFLYTSRIVGQWGSWQHPTALSVRNLLLTYPFIYWFWHKLLKRSNVDFQFPFSLPFTSL